MGRKSSKENKASARRASGTEESTAVVAIDETRLVAAGPSTDMKSLGKAYHALVDAETGRSEYVRRHCADQIDALEKAQRELNERMESLAKDEKYDSLCDKVDAREQNMQRAMRSVRRSFEDAACAVLEDKGLTPAERQAKLNEMMVCAQSELKELGVPMGALMRAQVLTIL